MILRNAITAVILTVGSLGFAEGSSGSAHQNNPWLMQQAMQGDQTAQMMMMMGNSGGGGSGAAYASKAADLQKAIEQPAQAIQKRADDQLKAMQTANDKLSAEATKSFQANTPKDEKLDDKLVAQLSTPPPDNRKAMDADTNDLIAQGKALSEAQISAAGALTKGFINPMPTPQKQVNTMADRMGWNKAAPSNGGSGGGLAAAAEARTPASEGGSDPSALNHNPGAGGGMTIPNPLSQRGFAPGLIHNPPAGF